MGSVSNSHLGTPLLITHKYCCEGGQERSQSPWLGISIQLDVSLRNGLWTIVEFLTQVHDVHADNSYANINIG